MTAQQKPKVKPATILLSLFFAANSFAQCEAIYCYEATWNLTNDCLQMTVYNNSTGVGPINFWWSGESGFTNSNDPIVACIPRSAMNGDDLFNLTLGIATSDGCTSTVNHNIGEGNTCGTAGMKENQTKAAELSFTRVDNHYSFSTNGQGWLQESTLVLYDAAGRIMMERRLLPNEQSGDLPPLDPGICFYRLVAQGTILVNGKFIVH